MHSIRADVTNRQILSTLPAPSALSSPIFDASCLPDILRERPTSAPVKTYAVAYMSTKTHSFEYTRKVLAKLNEQARAEVARLGGNVGVEKILDMLVVRDEESDRALEPNV